MVRLLETKIIDYGKEGEVTYSVKFRRGGSDAHIGGYKKGESRVVTITEEEREILKSESTKRTKFMIKARAKIYFGSEDAESIARVEAMMNEAIGAHSKFIPPFLPPHEKDDEVRKLSRELGLKKCILREEWDEQNTKGKSFLAKLRLHNPYYELSSGDTSGIG